ncbi:ATP-binding protein [Lactobacillus acetotolerans]|uniref:ATP-binding protein n=1 Tax=Lactobacillus acetotolerans TaxID=1600 RepID=A0A5P5ZGI4_9LACO|nr:ATP-binding protein [Lactobacillus acetotolerans]KRN38346.1 aaa+ superfamily atpase [Lactobacillus acetotolerans DSM 20749 = JCM 3825]QFG50767.1 ATP-binding protein [Lactobacillus acetotolerans]GGV17738.1 ATPase [Lactobacillus acetotolerans DSM 20749 = JCM 3825]
MLEQKYVARDEYLNFLKRNRDKHIIKVVSGVRRSGKSTLFLLFRDYLKKTGVKDNQIINLNFEDMDFEDLLDPEKLYSYIKKKLLPDQMNYIFLDEIQHVHNFEKVADSLFIKDNVDLYITGSNAYFLSGEIATLLTGRYVQLNMLPLSFNEFVQWHKQNNKFTNDQDMFNQYLKSSFPYTLFTETDQERIEYLQGIYSTIVLTDIVTRLNIKDVPVLERLIRTLFSNIGSQVTINKITNTLRSNGYKTSNKTIDRYLEGILDSLLMYEAKRYDIHDHDLLSSNSKYYVVDLGLCRLLLPDHQEDYGHIIENVVYLELLRRFPNVYVGQSGKYEVDFVALNGRNEARYFQVALTTLDENVLKRELRSLQRIGDSYPKYLLTLDTLNKDANYNGIQKMNIIDWLLEK